MPCMHAQSRRSSCRCHELRRSAAQTACVRAHTRVAHNHPERCHAGSIDFTRLHTLSFLVSFLPSVLPCRQHRPHPASSLCFLSYSCSMQAASASPAGPARGAPCMPRCASCWRASRRRCRRCWRARSRGSPAALQLRRQARQQARQRTLRQRRRVHLRAEQVAAQGCQHQKGKGQRQKQRRKHRERRWPLCLGGRSLAC